jgi:hypothetical protein
LARHCPECGFVVTEGANYCQRCGAYVGPREDTRDDATTATYMVDEQTGELRPVDVGDIAESTGALVIRSGGGRVGQSYPLEGERLTTTSPSHAITPCSCAARARGSSTTPAR